MDEDAPAVFKKNPRQREAIQLLNDNTHTLLYGGSRSGKTFITIRNMVLRALKKPSRHLVIRLRNIHVNISIVQDTFPKVMSLCFPEIPYELNKSLQYATLPAPGGKESTIWFAGSDDPARVERVLGNEYSTIFANEVSQIAWETILVMWTRLAENTGLDLKFYYDCNPPSMKHWAYTMFFKGEDPKGEPIQVPIDLNDFSKGMKAIPTASLLMNPADNPHLDQQYLAILHSLPERQRARFLKGAFVADVEGALWNFEMVTACKVRQFDPEIRETVIAVDPSVSSTEDADECGIMVCSKSIDGSGVVEKDLTKQLPPAQWAARVVDAYHEYEANCVIAEVNQGGDMVEDMIHNSPGGEHIVVKKVHGKKSKYARAEPVAQLYEQGEISHAEAMPELEDELTTYVPRDAKFSPNRLDALVYGLTYLCINETDSFGIG